MITTINELHMVPTTTIQGKSTRKICRGSEKFDRCVRVVVVVVIVELRKAK